MLWNPKPFWHYLLTSIALTIVVVIGFLLLVVPGIILALALSFSLYLVIEKKMNTIAAFKESMRLTRSNRVSLFALGLVLGIINILGAIVFVLPLLVTAPISMLASVHAYRILSGRPHEAEVKEPAPAVAPA
jgi:uncharacterized membrane protein